MARSSLYTVSFLDLNDTVQVSRFFNTLAAARKWSAFLVSTSYAKEVAIHLGPVGGALIERRAAR